VENSMERSWDLYQMTKKPNQIAKSLPNYLLFLMMVLIQSSGDDLLSEGNLQKPFLCSWTITQ
jgi:hypothetical protein